MGTGEIMFCDGLLGFFIVWVLGTIVRTVRYNNRAPCMIIIAQGARLMLRRVRVKGGVRRR